jgi:hypothetical protein
LILKGGNLIRSEANLTATRDALPIFNKCRHGFTFTGQQRAAKAAGPMPQKKSDEEGQNLGKGKEPQREPEAGGGGRDAAHNSILFACQLHFHGWLWPNQLIVILFLLVLHAGDRMASRLGCHQQLW